jgi:hypothetical protein
MLYDIESRLSADVLPDGGHKSPDMQYAMTAPDEPECSRLAPSCHRQGDEASYSAFGADDFQCAYIVFLDPGIPPRTPRAKFRLK